MAREINVKIDSDGLVDMLIDRLDIWTQNEEIKDAFAKMYKQDAEDGLLDDIDVSFFGISKIVDNDWVNWISVLEKDEVEAEDWKASLQEMQCGELDSADITLRTRNLCAGDYLSIITDSVALIRS